MQSKPDRSHADDDLRSRAEGRLRKRTVQQRASGAGDRVSVADTRRALHELHVHQIELEMQNEALQAARDEVESLLGKYTDLYDFAPVGYFSLDENGRILEANLTGASLLGVVRSQLVGQRLLRFVAPENHAHVAAFIDQLFAEPQKHFCEVMVQKVGGADFCVHMHGLAVESASTASKECRVAISDITALKQAEEARHHMETMVVVNKGLRQEIARRQAVEDALRESESHQTQLLTQAHAMKEQLRRLAHQVLQAQEEERKRISRDLHDGVTQTLVEININLETLSREVEVDPRRAKRRIAKTQRVVEKAVNIVHLFARDLRPAVLDDLGLIPALRTFVKGFTIKTGIPVLLTMAVEVEKVTGPKRTALYRVALEALANVAHHAHATQAEVTIQRAPGGLTMQVKDNGKSFNAERTLHANEGKRLGLIGMRERMEMVGGRFGVESAPGQGTTIHAHIPFRFGAKERLKS